jgi:transcriptional regulator with XRE-family HTH domain
LQLRKIKRACTHQDVPDSAKVERSSEHPLKLLRTITGASQQGFAEAIGLSWNSIRSIEIGRRALTNERLSQIQSTIGAIWDEPNQQWYFDPGGFSGRRMPYLREHYETFRLELRREVREREFATYYLTWRFLQFCTGMPDAKFNAWFWRMEQRFNRWAKEFNLVHENVLEIEPLWDPQLARTVGYRKFFPTLLQGDEKRFPLMIAGAQKEKQHLREVLFPSHQTYTKSEVSQLWPKKTKPRSRQPKAEK